MTASSDKPELSVIIPAFNSAEWLETTIAAVEQALARTPWTAEVVVVDDGSTDETAETLTGIAEGFRYDLRVVPQDNAGVFVAVWTGLQNARADHVLILNSRLLVHEGALSYLDQAGALGSGLAWNGHVVTDPTAPLIGRFWEVPTHVFWGTYLGHPKPTDITSENFDRVPKGTGCLLIPKAAMIEAYQACWPDQNARFSSDDTKLLRHISARQVIRLDPGFSATYRPRTTFRRFLAHAAGRGTMFVDSYAGTNPGRDAALIGLVAAPPVLLVTVVAAAVARRWGVVGGALVLVSLGILAPAVIAAARRAPGRAIVSYLTYILPFGAVFWRGLARGVVLHRGAFFGRTSKQDSGGDV